MNAETVWRQYVGTALWASVDDNGDPLDDWAGIEDVAPESLKRLREIVNDFLSLCESVEGFEDLDAEQVGHDLWLTQNRHGAGVWDRGLGQLGQRLTEISHSWGSSIFTLAMMAAFTALGNPRQ